MTSTIRLSCAGWPSELNTQRANIIKAGNIHSLQDGNMVATLWKDKRLFAILSASAEPEIVKVGRKAPGKKKK